MVITSNNMKNIWPSIYNEKSRLELAYALFEFPASLYEFALSTDKHINPKWFSKCTELKLFSVFYSSADLQIRVVNWLVS